MVVRIAISEQPIERRATNLLDAVARAQRRAKCARSVIQPPASATHSANTARPVRLRPSSRCQRPAAAATAGETDIRRHIAGDHVAHVVQHQRQFARLERLHVGRHRLRPPGPQ